MKKILFCARDLSTGGVQKSLINLLKALKPQMINKEIEVDLFLLKKIGELINEVPDCVKIIEANKCFWEFGVTNKQAGKLKKSFKVLRRIKAALSRVFTNKIFLKHALVKQQHLGQYDAVISFAVSISNRSLYAGWAEVALEKTDSPNKIVYIHNDFIRSSLNNSYTLNLIKRFDKIVFVSKSCKESFVDNIPDLYEKCFVLNNIIDSNEILLKAKETCSEINLNQNVINFVSVSRLSPEKGFLRSLAVMKKLKEDGFKFVWHILGDGPMKLKINREIARLGLGEYVKLYGNQNNPYKFIKLMDFLFLGSFHESFGLVLIEAMILQVPVISTKTISSQEIIQNNGFVCENDEQGIYLMLKEILTNTNKIRDAKENLKNYSYDNESILSDFQKIIGG